MFRHVHIWDSGYIGFKEEKTRRFIYVVNEDSRQMCDSKKRVRLRWRRQYYTKTTQKYLYFISPPMFIAIL